MFHYYVKDKHIKKTINGTNNVVLLEEFQRCFVTLKYDI